jgi:hypothetical protein
MENVRIYEIPACKIVSTQCGMFGARCAGLEV